MKEIKKTPPKGALERIADLERQVVQLVSAINQSLQQEQAQRTELANLVFAIKEQVGSDVVDAVLAERHRRTQLELAENARRWIEQRVAEGTLAAVGAVDQDCIVVAAETDNEGAQLGAGRLQLTYDRIRPDIQEKILGQGPGFICATGENSRLEVLEIYKIAPKQAATAA